MCAPFPREYTVSRGVPVFYCARIPLPKQQKTRQNLSGFLWRRKRDSFLSFAKQPWSAIFMLCKSLRSAAKNDAPCRFLNALVRIPLIKYRKTKRTSKKCLSVLLGGGRGIRTPVGFHPNGFQDRLVMTASIFLLDITVESIAIIAHFVNRISKIVALKSVVVFGDVARDVFDHFAGDNKSRDRRNERKRTRRRATARIHVVRVRRGFLFHRFFG